MKGFCAVAFALAGSSMLTMFMNKRHTRRFEASLDDEQRMLYSEIKRERMRIFLGATVLAVVVGFALGRRGPPCFAAAAALTTQTLVYLLWPKSRYMMEHVKSPEQSALWMRKYKHMAFLGNAGSLLGLGVFATYTFA